MSYLEEIQKISKKIEDNNVSYYDFIPYLFWAKDEEDRFTDINNKALKILFPHHKKEDVIGKTGLELAKEYEGKKYEAGIVCSDTDKICRETQKEIQQLESFYIIDKMVYLQVNKAPVFNKRGEVIGTVGIGIDTTEIVEDHNKIVDTIKERDWDKLETAFNNHVKRQILI